MLEQVKGFKDNFSKELPASNRVNQFFRGSDYATGNFFDDVISILLEKAVEARKKAYLSQSQAIAP